MDSAPSLDFPDLSDLDDDQAYEVKLEAFTGPMDLLLHLIRKQKINIYDIPIALIARQYLEYLTLMKTLNLSLAGEFLVMASTLLYIKSRTLLPKEATSEAEDEEVIDDDGPVRAGCDRHSADRLCHQWPGRPDAEGDRRTQEEPTGAP